MIQESFLEPDGHIAYRGTYSDATFTIRNFSDADDVLVASDVKITQSIYDTYFNGSAEVGGTDMEAFFPIGAAPSNDDDRNRRLWLLGYI